MGRLFSRLLEFCGFIVKTYALTDSSAAKAIATRAGVGQVRHLDTRSLWLQAEVKQGPLVMLKVGTEDNLADIGTRGHDKVKLEKLSKLNNPIGMDVEEHRGAIVASVANVSSVKSSTDLRAALAAVAIVAAA